jgi:hypothetical protein
MGETEKGHESIVDIENALAMAVNKEVRRMKGWLFGADAVRPPESSTPALFPTPYIP